MRIIISGYFDAGFSIGIDDYPFEKEAALSSLNTGNDFRVSFSKPDEMFAFVDEVSGEAAFHVDDAEGHIGLSVPVGTGLKIDLSGSSMLKNLHNEALEAASNKSFMGSYYSSSKVFSKRLVSPKHWLIYMDWE